MTSDQIIEVGKALLPYLRDDLSHAELGIAAHDAAAALRRSGAVTQRLRCDLTAQKVTYSSVVGQIVTLHDQAGAVVAQLAIHGVRVDLPYRETADDIADLIVASFNDPPERQP